MPKYAILVVYENMLADQSAFIARMRGRYQGFDICQFDDGKTESDFTNSVKKCKADDSLKIFICGHGGKGIYFITDESRKRRQSLEALTKLLKAGLRDRCKSPAASKYTEVNMLACQFGRAPGGRVSDSAAVRLHRNLCRDYIYVNLVARTETLSTTPTGRTTLHPWKKAFYATEDYKDSLSDSQYASKANYTKIVCTFREDVPIVRIRAYASDEWINATSMKASQILWADAVVDTLLENIQLAGNGKPSDFKQNLLFLEVRAYENSRDTERLKKGMESLLKNNKDFTSHRGLGALFGSDSLPRTAQLVQDLLLQYPNYPRWG